MSKHKSLSRQMHFVISQNMKIGQQRRAQSKAGIDTKKSIYSLRYADNLRKFVNVFSKYLNKNFPEVRDLRDIQVNHVQSFLDRNLKNSNFGITTAKKYLGYANKLSRMAEETFKSCKLDFSSVTLPKTTTEEKLERNIAMTREDLEKLMKYMESHNSCAKFVPSLVSTSGLRADEISFCRPEHVKFNEDGTAEVSVFNAKGGRFRTVILDRNQAKPWCKAVNYAKNHGWQTLTKNYNTDNMQTSLRRGLKAVGISEKYPHQCNHAIRKLFAIETFKKNLAKGMSEERAWNLTSEALGHGWGRKDLQKIYLSGINEESD